MPPSAPTGQRAAASFSLGEEGNTTVDIVIQPAYQQLEAVKALLLEYTSMLLEQNPAAAGSCLQRQNFEGELANLAEKYGAPQGRLYLIRVDGAPAGCAAMSWAVLMMPTSAPVHPPPVPGPGPGPAAGGTSPGRRPGGGVRGHAAGHLPLPLPSHPAVPRPGLLRDSPIQQLREEPYLHAKRSETGITAEPSGSAVFSPRDPTPAAFSAGPGPAAPFRRSGPARRTAPG